MLGAPDGGQRSAPATADIGASVGLLPSQRIAALVRRKVILAADDIAADQIQPASLDLRLGRTAHRVRASFLPGTGKTVHEQLGRLSATEVDLEEGAVLEKGAVYIVELQEHVNLTTLTSISAVANPKSSTGRLDVFTRLITDGGDAFDKVVTGYEGPLFAEISPRTFPIRVRRGSRLNQLRFRRRASSQDPNADFRVSDRELVELNAETPLAQPAAAIRNGLNVGVGLTPDDDGLVGYRAKRYTDVVDIDRVAAHEVRDFWEPVAVGAGSALILDPDQFYVLASRERVQIPAGYAAEMQPIDPAMGEFRVHYAGFFDPGFGMTPDGRPGSRAVLEVRSYEVPFQLVDGQSIGRLVFERMSEEPETLYGQTGASNYQGQGLKLSKHFR